jgi:hypothetical protein
MSSEPACPQCRFLTRQLGRVTKCLLHLSPTADVDGPARTAAAMPSSSPTAAPAPAEDYDEPYTFGQLRVSVDRPGPFTLRQYVRLQLLRTRVTADPSPLDMVTPAHDRRSLASR